MDTDWMNGTGTGQGLSERRRPARNGYFDGISRIIEYGVLVFVVLLTLLGNYAIHINLMNDVLLA